MVPYNMISAEERTFFEDAVRRNLTRQKPVPKPKRRRADSSSEESSATIDPLKGGQSLSAVGAHEFVQTFRDRALAEVLINYQTEARCPATVSLILTKDMGQSVTYFPRLSAAENINAFCNVENIIQLMCKKCAIPFKVITVLDDIRHFPQLPEE